MLVNQLKANVCTASESHHRAAFVHHPENMPKGLLLINFRVDSRKLLVQFTVSTLACNFISTVVLNLYKKILYVAVPLCASSGNSCLDL